MRDDAPISGFRSIGEIAPGSTGYAGKCCATEISYARKYAAVEVLGTTHDGLTETRLIGASEMTALADYKPIRLGTIGEHSENFPASDAAPEGQEGGE